MCMLMRVCISLTVITKEQKQKIKNIGFPQDITKHKKKALIKGETTCISRK